MTMPITIDLDQLLTGSGRRGREREGGREVKLVINKCYGGFGLSIAATLELHKRGALPGVPVREYYGKDIDDMSVDLQKWRDYLANPAAGRNNYLTIFSPDESRTLYARDVPRNNPDLVAIVEEMGEAANGMCADLRVVEIPDGEPYEISEYDGSERVESPRRYFA